MPANPSPSSLVLAGIFSMPRPFDAIETAHRPLPSADQKSYALQRRR
jgi:hypothetical protein